MSASLLARDALRRSAALRGPMMRKSPVQQMVQKRGIHIENTVGNNMPFNYNCAKPLLGFKVAAFMLSGFSLPFLAAQWQIYKSGSA